MERDADPSDGELEAIEALVRDIGESGREIADEELQRLREYLATVSLRRRTVARVDDDLGGLPWKDQILKGGDWIDRLEAKYLKHVVEREEWPEGTTPDEYAESLAEAVQDAHAAVYIEWDRGDWKLVFAARSGVWRGKGGGPYIVVGFLPTKNFWVTGFQPEAGLHDVARNQSWTGGRWLRGLR